jgi:outer membrane protein OmpA-like peptidoglycan-associated protein
MSNSLFKILTAFAFLALCLGCALLHKSTLESHFSQKLQQKYAEIGQPVKSVTMNGMEATLQIPHDAKYDLSTIENATATVLPWIYKTKYTYFSIPGKGDKKGGEGGGEGKSEQEGAKEDKGKYEKTREGKGEQEGAKEDKGGQEVNVSNVTKLESAFKGLKSEPLLFEPESSIISQSSFAALDQIIEVMNENPKATLSILGHTNDIGSASENLQLSQERAESVKRYLLKNGFQGAERITAKGFGESQPLCTQKTVDCRSQNRRVILQAAAYKTTE